MVSNLFGIGGILIGGVFVGKVRLSAGTGLDIALDVPPKGALPRALIYIQDDAAAFSRSACALAIRLSPGQLRSILSDTVSVEAVLALAGNGGLPISVENSTVVRRIIEDIRRASSNDVVFFVFLRGQVLKLLAEAMDVRTQTVQTVDEGNRSAWIVRDILLTDPLHPPSLTELGRLTGVPPRKLSTQFHAQFGKTIYEWLLDWRLSGARDLLVGSGASIKEIALSLGYAHVSAFTAAFTRRFGVSPSELRTSAPFALGGRS